MDCASLPHALYFEMKPDGESDLKGVRRKLRNLKRIDGCSAFISLITIVVTFGVTISCFEKGNLTLYEDRRIWINQSKTEQGMFKISTGVPGCQVKSLPSNEFAMEAEYSYIRGGVDQWESPLFNQYLFLLWIFTVSCFFQSMRCYWNDAEKYEVHDDDSVTTHIEEEPASIFKTFIWNEETHYIPRGPDLGRWVEYASTSPLQVIIVAVNVGIESRQTLFCIIMVQTLLIYQGYCIELYIDKIWHNKYKEQILKWITTREPKTTIRNGTASLQKRDPASTHAYDAIRIVYQSKRRERDTETTTLLTLNFAVWGSHFTLWFTLVSEYLHSVSELDTCYSRGPPSFVPWLLGVQFFCFTCFGFAQFLQWMQLKYEIKILDVFNHCWNHEYSIIPDPNISLEQLSTKLKIQRDIIWLDATFYYSVLSVTAKLTLDVIFLSGSLALYSCF